LNAGLVLAIDADLSVNDFQMGFMLICEIFERHQNVVDVDLWEIIFWVVLVSVIRFYLSFIYQ